MLSQCLAMLLLLGFLLKRRALLLTLGMLMFRPKNSKVSIGSLGLIAIGVGLGVGVAGTLGLIGRTLTIGSGFLVVGLAFEGGISGAFAWGFSVGNFVGLGVVSRIMGCSSSTFFHCCFRKPTNSLSFASM